jgi:soluble lytic murein transglycosylase-like protein
MDLGSISKRAAPLAALLALVATQAAAQQVDDRYPFLRPAAPAPAQTDYVRVGGNQYLRVNDGTQHVAAHAVARRARAAARVPFPPPAPVRAATAEPASADDVAPTRLAYAAQPNDDGLSIWSMIPIRPAHRPPAPVPVAVAPETSALPHLEHRILRGRDTHIFSPDLLVLIENKALAHGVPLDLAHAMITVESNYDPRLTGAAGAVGLMQIKYATARGMGYRGSVRELYNPATNLEWGMRYLAQARKLARGNLCGTVLRYQAGHGAVRMTHAAATYCAKVRALIAASDNPRQIARARSIR